MKLKIQGSVCLYVVVADPEFPRRRRGGQPIVGGANLLLPQTA